MQESLPMFVSASDSVKIWDAEHMRTLRQYNCNDSSSGSNFKDVAWNSDNTLLASVSTTGGIVLYDWTSTNGNNSGDIRQEFFESTEQTSVCFGLSGSSLFSGGATGDINLWNCQTGKRTKTFKECHQSPVKRIDKIGEEKIVSACATGEIIIWEIESGSVCSKLKSSKPQSLRGLEQSPWVISVLATTSDDGAVCLWDTEKHETKHVFTRHDAPAMDLSFSPLNHLLLASCGLDKKVIFYDIQGNNVVKTINSSQPLTAVCFLSNGVHVCAGSSMGNLYKYDLRKSEEPLYSIHAHSTSIQRLVLESSKKKNLRKSSRSSRTSSSKTSGQKVQKSSDQPHNDQLRPSVSENTKSNLRVSQDHTKNRRSWSSKVPDIEVSANETKTVNGDGILSPGKSAPNRKSLLEKNLGLQTPVNRSVASTRRDTMGSYCEGIFSPVGSVNDSVNDDAAFTPASQNKPQRTSKGSMLPKANPYASFNFNTPASINSANRLPLEQNGEMIPATAEETSMARGSISGQLSRISRSDTKVNHSTPFNGGASGVSVNGAPPSSTSLSPNSEMTSEKLQPQNKDNSVNTMVNGGATASTSLHQEDFVQSNPFQYQLEFLQNTVREMIEEHEDNVRDELRHLHMQLIKMFAEQNERIRQLAEQSSVNPLLLQEIERLRIENDRLRRKY